MPEPEYIIKTFELSSQCIDYFDVGDSIEIFRKGESIWKTGYIEKGFITNKNQFFQGAFDYYGTNGIHGSTKDTFFILPDFEQKYIVTTRLVLFEKTIFLKLTQQT